MVRTIYLDKVTVVGLARGKDRIIYQCQTGDARRQIPADVIWGSEPDEDELRPGVTYRLEVDWRWANKEGLLP
jgi:hypothetical protein